jgi:hypothetical protein
MTSVGKDFQRKDAKVQRRNDLAILISKGLFFIFFPLRLRGLCDFELKFFLY